MAKSYGSDPGCGKEMNTQKSGKSGGGTPYKMGPGAGSSKKNKAKK